MSASICWEPADKEPKTFNVGAPSEFEKKLGEATLQGELPFELDESDLPVIKAIALYDDQYKQVVKKIEKYGSIRIWAEY